MNYALPLLAYAILQFDYRVRPAFISIALGHTGTSDTMPSAGGAQAGAPLAFPSSSTIQPSSLSRLTLSDKLLLSQAVHHIGTSPPDWGRVSSILLSHPLIKTKSRLEQAAKAGITLGRVFGSRECERAWVALMRQYNLVLQPGEKDMSIVDENDPSGSPATGNRSKEARGLPPKMDRGSQLALAQFLYAERIREIQDHIKAKEEAFKTLVDEIEKLNSGASDEKLLAELERSGRLREEAAARAEKERISDLQRAANADDDSSTDSTAKEGALPKDNASSSSTPITSPTKVKEPITPATASDTSSSTPSKLTPSKEREQDKERSGSQGSPSANKVEQPRRTNEGADAQKSEASRMPTNDAQVRTESKEGPSKGESDLSQSEESSSKPALSASESHKSLQATSGAADSASGSKRKRESDNATEDVDEIDVMSKRPREEHAAPVVETDAANKVTDLVENIKDQKAMNEAEGKKESERQNSQQSDDVDDEEDDEDADNKDDDEEVNDDTDEADEEKSAAGKARKDDGAIESRTNEGSTAARSDVVADTEEQAKEEAEETDEEMEESPEEKGEAIQAQRQGSDIEMKIVHQDDEEDDENGETASAQMDDERSESSVKMEEEASEQAGVESRAEETEEGGDDDESSEAQKRPEPRRSRRSARNLSLAIDEPSTPTTMSAPPSAKNSRVEALRSREASGTSLDAEEGERDSVADGLEIDTSRSTNERGSRTSMSPVGAKRNARVTNRPPSRKSLRRGSSTGGDAAGTSARTSLGATPHEDGAASSDAERERTTSKSTAVASAPATTRDHRKMEKVLMMLLNEVSNHTHGNLFHAPIKESDAPDYYQLIRHPLDLKTIKARIKEGRISTSTQLRRALMQMFANSLIYNRPGSDIYRMALEMRDAAEEMLDRFEQTQLSANISRR